jgi:UDP-N-acetyl-D-mannosaminuronate dehydrogenase
MTAELRRYEKFVSGSDDASVALVEEHFQAVGVRTARMVPIEQLELAKLLETSYFGLLIAWAQEMDRFSTVVGGDYWDLFAFFDEIEFLPRARFEPGFIGGHCVMPNLELLEAVRPSLLAVAIRESNHQREYEVLRSGGSTTERRRPRLP